MSGLDLKLGQNYDIKVSFNSYPGSFSYLDVVGHEWIYCGNHPFGHVFVANPTDTDNQPTNEMRVAYLHEKSLSVKGAEVDYISDESPMIIIPKKGILNRLLRRSLSKRLAKALEARVKESD
ncbi:MAG: hypothetical protein ABIH72_01540 [archaeon]